MGPGHFAIALAAKPAAPKMPLWVLLVASEVLDILTFGFKALGMEDFGVNTTSLERGLKVIVPGTIPWSHGLFMSIVWSVVATAIAYLFYRDRRTSSMIGLVVFSHWVLDFIVHPGELPLLFSSSPTVGLGLWTSGPGLILSGVLEFLLLAGGMTIYFIWRKRNDANR
jgi:membrane-bound metal-dependent hydrolase YbcI (DUF457 family)